MSQATEQESREAQVGTDLTAAVQRVLAASDQPLTLSKIRSALSGNYRRIGLEELADVLRRQVAANVLYQYPKYRSAQDRFWDRPMRVHIGQVDENAHRRDLGLARALHPPIFATLSHHDPPAVERHLRMHPARGRVSHLFGETEGASEPVERGRYVTPRPSSTSRRASSRFAAAGPGGPDWPGGA